MGLVKLFIAGFFITNGIPHLVKGITGQKHMTPFKKVSSSTLNIVWAFTNFVIGFALLGWFSAKEIILPAGTDLIAFLLGSLAVALYLAAFWSNPNARLPWHKK